MRKLSPFALVLLWPLVGIPILAQAEAPPSLPLPMVTIFDLESGLRPLGMGGAFVGLADDENAVFYNPAGLGFGAPGLRFDSLFARHLGLTSYARAALARGPFGLGLALLNSGPITGRDAQGEETGRFSYYLLGLAGAYGTKLTALALAPPLQIQVPKGLEGLAIGFRLKLYRVKTLAEGSGSTLVLDPALLYSFGNLSLGGLTLEDLRLGLVVENLLGPGMRYGSGHREVWARRVRAGVGIILPRTSLAADLESNGNFHLGGEHRFTELKGIDGLALRAGLLLGNRFVISLGLGLTLGNFRLDYALVVNPQFSLPPTHALALHLDLCLDLDDP